MKAFNVWGNSSPIVTTTVNAYTTPTALSINSGASSLVASGNLKVALSTDTDLAINNAYYWLSIDPSGNTTTFSNTYILANSQVVSPFFYINTFTVAGTYSVYVKKINIIGNSATHGPVNFNIYTTPFPISTLSLSSTISTYITVSTTDTNNNAQNGVQYFYYTYDTSTANNESGNVLAYTAFQTYAPTTTFNIINRINRLYTVYIISKNPIGNTIGSPVSGNVIVYTTPSLATLDTANTKTTATGNILVSLFDTVNTPLNEAFYFYSTNGGTTYSNSFVKYTGTAPNNQYQFTITKDTGTNSPFVIGQTYNVVYKTKNSLLTESGTFVSNAITVYTTPSSPIPDNGNTASTTSGYLLFSLFDTANLSGNDVFYWYSIDGETSYANTGVKYTQISPYRYSYTITTGITIGQTYTVYVKAISPVGNSASVSFTPVTIFNRPSGPILDTINTKTNTSGTLTVAFSDNINTYINDIQYIYYLYDTTTETNDFGNISLYSDSTKTLLNGITNYSFVISSLSNKIYTLYLVAKNTLSNSIAGSVNTYGNVAVYITPAVPVIDNVNTLSVASGNVKVSLIDASNLNINDVFYLWSTDGINYANSNVKADYPSKSTYTFYINNLVANTYTIYVKGTNAIGNSTVANTQSISVYTTPAVPVIDNVNTLSVESGNVKVSLIDASNLNINNVFYLWSTDGINYANSNVKADYPSKSTYTFYINQLVANTYTVYVKAYNNAWGNSTVANTQSISVYTIPAVPTIDTANTRTVSTGNLRVSVLDNSNISLNNAYYWYSTDGTNFANSYIKNTSSVNSPYSFFISPLTDISYSVYVKLRNTVGNSSAISTRANVFVTPYVPTAYTTSNPTSGTIVATFSDTNFANYFLNNNVGYYYYLYGNNVGTNQSTNISSYGAYTGNAYVKDVLDYRFVVSGLAENTYTLYLIAQNTVGNSYPISSRLSVYTTPNPVTSVNATLGSSGNLQILVTDTNNTVLNSIYYLYYAYPGDGSNNSGNLQVYSNSKALYVSSPSTFFIDGLLNKTYTVYVSTRNSVGNSVTSVYSTPTIVYTTPLSPTPDNGNILHINSLGNLTVSFIDTANFPNNRVDYWYSMDGGNTYANTNVSYTGSKSIYSYTISGLSNGIPYTVYTIARNSVGNSAPIATPPTILLNNPDPPILYYAGVNNRSIDISFSTPIDNGNAIIRYECSVDNMITYADIGLPLNNQYNIPNLENGTVYSVSVRAVNYGGNSTASNAKYVIPATIPDPPVVYTLTGDRNIDISFDTPLSNGGNAITRYEYSLNNGNTYIPIGFPRNNLFNIYGLVNGNTYEVCMRAVNYRGNSLVSNIIPTIPFTVPKEPIITAVISKHNALEVFFQPPTDNGGAPILGYKYAYVLGNIFAT